MAGCHSNMCLIPLVRKKKKERKKEKKKKVCEIGSCGVCLKCTRDCFCSFPVTGWLILTETLILELFLWHLLGGKKVRQRKISSCGFTMESSSSALRWRQRSAVNSYCSTHVWRPTRDLLHVEALPLQLQGFKQRKN